jgi:phosphohistidine phosphatase
VRILLVRHAEAAPGEPDDARRLTAHGREQAAALGRSLAGEDVAVVLTSPLGRAVETAEAIARGTGARVGVEERLAPGAQAEELVAAAREADAGERVVVAVGHQPDCGLIAAELTGGAAPPFPPGGTAAIDVP